MKNPRKTIPKETKLWMKENGYTETQMDGFWKENYETNFLLGLDVEKRKSYLKKYPEPEYFQKNILGLDVINYL